MNHYSRFAEPTFCHCCFSILYLCVCVCVCVCVRDVRGIGEGILVQELDLLVDGEVEAGFITSHRWGSEVRSGSPCS